MDLPMLLSPLTPLDLAAVLLLFVAWPAMGYLIEYPGRGRASVAFLMDAYRAEWLRHAITREPRVFDAMIMVSLREGTAFFASACMIAIGGGLALIGNTDRLSGIARDLELEALLGVPWEIKLLPVLLLITAAFLNFVWANRLFGYCSVMMGAIPNDPADPRALRRAEQAAALNGSAARSFNRGLRAVYFALGALAWLAGPVPLIAATAVTLVVLWRREFASHSRAVLVSGDPAKEMP